MPREFIGLSVTDVTSLPERCASCSFWECRQQLPLACGAADDADAARDWIRDVAANWGECGRVAVQDGQVLGFIKYAPPVYVPQARFLPSGPPLSDAVLITCLHMVPEARQHGVGGVLLREAMRDLAARGERCVQAYATTRQGDISDQPVVGSRFLERYGFTVVRPHPEVPLMTVDLRSVVSWQENLETILASLLIPLPRRVPALCRGRRE